MAKSKAWLMLVLTNLFWAGNYVFGKYVVADLSPVWITFSRWTLALLLLFPIAIFIDRPDWRTVGKAWMPLIGMGITGVVTNNLFIYGALEYTTSTNAALVSALNPAVIVLFSYFLLREKINWLQLTGFVLSLVGVFIVLTRGQLLQLFTHEYNRGDVLMLGAVLCWTLYSIISKRLSQIPPITATTVSTFYGMVLLSPFAMMQGVNWHAVGPLAITGVIYMTLFPSVASFIFWNLSVRDIGASRTGITLNLIPVFTAIIGGFLGDRISSSQAWGGLLVLTGVYLTSGVLNKFLETRKTKRMTIAH